MNDVVRRKCIEKKRYLHFNVCIYQVFDPTWMWCPKLIILNIDGSVCEEHIDYSLTPGDDNNLALVQLVWRFKGFFKENLELQHFPMDVQVTY